jgi:hypothetical protein
MVRAEALDAEENQKTPVWKEVKTNLNFNLKSSNVSCRIRKALSSVSRLGLLLLCGDVDSLNG